MFVGSDGTIASEDYAPHVTVQTRARPEPHTIPADRLPEGRRNAIEYVLSCITEGRPIEGPLDPALCLTAQRIVDTAALSAASLTAPAWAASAPSIRRLRSVVSAITPAGSESRNIGRKTAVCTRAARNDEPVSSTISQAVAMACMALPMK